MKNAMTNAGLICRDELIADGKLRRFDAEGDRPKSGNAWYILYDGDVQAGAFGSWKMGIKEKWCSKSDVEFSPEERAAYKKIMEAARRQRVAEQEKVEAECREWCAAAWKKAPAAGDDHPYLKKKGVPAFGLRMFKDSIMVPVRSLVGGGMLGVQFIHPDGTKKFKTGTAKKGAMHLIGEPIDNTMIIAEGYATAASIHLATGHAVLVAFDSGNLKLVADAARAKQPAWKLIVAADDDQFTKGNPGLSSAAEAARGVKGEMVKPRFMDEDMETCPTDFNDLHALRGLAAVKVCIFPPPEEDYDQHFEEPEEITQESFYNEEKSHCVFNGAPFKLLGYNHGDYFYLPNGTTQVKVLKATEHTKSNLIELAPLTWWQREFAGKQGIDMDMALNAMMRTSQDKRGVYDSDQIRGRGAWSDEGRSIVHLGNQLVVDGAPTKIQDFRATKYIYETAKEMGFDVKAPKLTKKEAYGLEELCELLSWEKKDISGKLLAGWCVISSICGALDWRPHIHITGGAGCGKSWIVDNIVRQIAGPGALVVQGATTEAGIRQSLGADARPVIYDEAEGEDRNAQQRMQSILELARQASSETGGSIYKGSTGGRAMSFRIRSCFCFSSIGASATQQADQSRISVLGLKNPNDGGLRFKTVITPKWKEVITTDFCKALRSRAIKLIPVIIINAKVFSEVLGHHLNSKRTGDQLGCLLAGDYALRSDGVIDRDEAQKFVESINWSEHKMEADQADEQRCLSAMLETLVRMPNGENQSIAELIRVVNSTLTIDETSLAQAALRQHGFRVVLGGFCVANSHAELKKIMEKTPWSSNWSRILSRLPGAYPTEKTIWFSGASVRAMQLPMSYVEGE